MANNIVVQGTIRRVIGDRSVEIPFIITGYQPDSVTGDSGNYVQWGYDTPILGANVDLLQLMRDAVLDAA